LTPPSAKPDANADADSEQTETDPSSGPDETEALTPVSRRALGPRRRLAAVELRVAHRRVSATSDQGDDSVAAIQGDDAVAAIQGDDTVVTDQGHDTVAAAEGGQEQSVGPVRLGPRARQRAARLAMSAQTDAAGAPEAKPDDDGIDDPSPLPPLVEEVSPQPAQEQLDLLDVNAPAVEAVTPAAMPQGEILIDDETSEDNPAVDGSLRRRNRIRAVKRAARVTKNNDAASYVVAPAVAMAQMRPRHYGVIAVFLLMVMLPTLSYSVYLWTRAADQFQSNVGFGSRTEEAASTFDFLGALGGISKNGSNDMDILNQFIISQELVAKLDQELDLKAIFSKPTGDPLNAFVKDGSIEDLVAFWQRMVIVNYDKATGLMALEVFAFDPRDAQKIAEAILLESTKIINDLSMTAQADTTRYSKDSLSAAEAKLSGARLAVLDYQVRNGIVDPTNTIANQNVVIGALNQQLATTQIELDMLTGTVGAKDVRIATLNRKIDVINNRIAEEQSKVGTSTDGTAEGFAILIQEFERLKVDQDFAERAYLASLAAYDQAVTDAQHKTRYLAAYVAPTLAESPTAPNRPLTALLVALIGFLLWAVVVLTYYALRDRR
jgi:capsular polysaccharide transport system permease protein